MKILQKQKIPSLLINVRDWYIMNLQYTGKVLESRKTNVGGKKNNETSSKKNLVLALAALMVLSLIPAAPHVHAEEYGATWTYGVSTDGNNTSYEWLQGAFTTSDEDYIYEEGQAYDWKVTLSPTKASATCTIEASLWDANGNSVGSVSKEVSVGRAPNVTTIVSPADFPEFGNQTGVFSLSVSVIYNGQTIAQLEAVFERTGAAGDSGNASVPEGSVEVTYKIGSEWIGAGFNTADADMIYDSNQAYDWTVYVSPSRSVDAEIEVEATIVDANGNLVDSLTKTVMGSEFTYAPSKTTLISCKDSLD